METGSKVQLNCHVIPVATLFMGNDVTGNTGQSVEFSKLMVSMNTLDKIILLPAITKCA